MIAANADGEGTPSIESRLSVVIELCNSAVLLHGSDELRAPESAARWLAARGYVLGGDASALPRLREEREVLRGFLSARADSETLARFNEVAQRHVAGARIGADGNLELLPLGGAADMAGAATVALLTWGSGSEGARLKVCAAPECRWAYYDTSRSRSRSWCDMNVCGVRHKMREYRARKEGASHDTTAL